MSGVRIERRDGSPSLRLDKARGNAIDEPLAEALACGGTAELAGDDGVRGVLLASAHPKLFCPGLDLVALAGVRPGRPMQRFMHVVRPRDLRLCLRAAQARWWPPSAGRAVAGRLRPGALTRDHRVLRAEPRSASTR